MGEMFAITIAVRPRTLNWERAAHWLEHRAETELWRTLAKSAALGRSSTDGRVKADVHGRIPPLQPHVVIDFHVWFPAGGVMADTGNNYPTCKAMIDGLVDAGVIDDDNHHWVEKIIMHKPRRTDGDAHVALTILGERR
jgi:hypothetical protein